MEEGKAIENLMKTQIKYYLVYLIDMVVGKFLNVYKII